jgi:putative ABC transport system substrate-binding protein
LEIRRAEDIGPAFEGAKGRADALYVCADPLANSNRVRINTFGNRVASAMITAG